MLEDDDDDPKLSGDRSGSQDDSHDLPDDGDDTLTPDTDDEGDDSQGDSSDGGDGGEGGDDAAAVAAADKRRRAIEARAAEQRAESSRLASETAAATARGVAEATTKAQRQAEAEREEREAMASMTDEQRATYQLAKETQRLKNGESQTHLLLRSTGDQNSFGRLMTRKPQFQKYEDEVERRHQDVLSRGGFTAREVILAHLIGEKTLKSEAGGQQSQAAARRLASQRSGASRSGRGDGGGGQGGNQRGSVVERAERDNWSI